MKEVYTLRQASEQLGVTVKALRYRIKTIGLEPRMEKGPHGSRYILSEDDLRYLAEPPEKVEETPENPPDPTRNVEHVAKSPQEGPQYRSEDPPQAIPVEIFLKAQESLQEALEIANQQREDRISAELRASQAEETSHRVLRQMEALKMELTGYKRLLSENAESIAEKEAAAIQIREQKSLAEQRLEELYQQNAEQKSHYEKTQADLTEQLREARERTSWLEKRVPKWVRKVFGAS